VKRAEFAGVMLYIAKGCGIPLSEQSAEVYFDLLGDLPIEVLWFAAKRAILENQYHVFPPVAMLRRLATAAMHDPDEIDGAEAWGIVRKLIVTKGYNRQADALAAMSPKVRAACEAIGWQRLCDSTEPESSRAQWVKTYDAIGVRVQRERLLPPAMRQMLQQIAPARPAELYEGRDPRSAAEFLEDNKKNLPALAPVGRVA
jgi:hypothetical protein